MNSCLNNEFSARLITVSGLVQGVGFRPFIYRLATEHQLSGWVRNCVGVVEIHVQGELQGLNKFTSLARPQLESDKVSDIGDFDAFSILQSQSQGEKSISVPTDLFLCDDCLEIGRASCRERV